MIKAIIQRIFKKEIIELEELKSKQKLLELAVANSQKILSEMQSAYDKCLSEHNDEVNDHKKDLEELRRSIELQKIYCYIIPRLLYGSGINLPNGFDISSYDDASNLRARLMNGDLKNY